MAVVVAVILIWGTIVVLIMTIYAYDIHDDSAFEYKQS